MLIEEEKPDYIPNTPLAINIMNIHHSEAHMHSEAIEFIYCLSGKAKLMVSHEAIPISPGEVIAVEHENVHCIYANEDNTILTLHLNLKEIQYPWEEVKYFYFSCSTNLCRPHQLAEMENVYDLLIGAAYIYAAGYKQQIKSLKYIGGKLAQLLIENFGWFSVEELNSEENIKFKDRLNNIITYVQKHYEEKITISQLAKREFINENYLSQFLKRTPFHSFTFMVNYARCYEAEKLLLNTEMSIQEISDACGFSSKKYFHKYFKHYWKNTPLQHKKWYERYALIPNEVESYSKEASLFILKTYLSERHVKKILDL